MENKKGTFNFTFGIKSCLRIVLELNGRMVHALPFCAKSRESLFLNTGLSGDTVHGEERFSLLPSDLLPQESASCRVRDACLVPLLRRSQPSTVPFVLKNDRPVPEFVHARLLIVR